MFIPTFQGRVYTNVSGSCLYQRFMRNEKLNTCVSLTAVSVTLSGPTSRMRWERGSGHCG